jgi:hypothetical protein
MTSDIERLAEDYRAIKAPPGVASRVRAGIDARPARNLGWFPVAATIVFAATIVGVLPMFLQGDAATPTVRPSLARLASMDIRKPDVAQPSLGRIRTLKAPPMPPRPGTKPAEEQTNTVTSPVEETDHA